MNRLSSNRHALGSRAAGPDHRHRRARAGRHHRRRLARHRGRQRLRPPARRPERGRLGGQRRRDRPGPAPRRWDPDRRRRPGRDGRHGRPRTNSTPTPRYYTNVTGQLLDAAGAVVDRPGGAAAQVGGGHHPAGRPGRPGRRQPDVRDDLRARPRVSRSSRASADATAVTGALTGGEFLPVVFPVSLAELRRFRQHDRHRRAVADEQPERRTRTCPPVGQEYIVPLCKTGGGSFMILDLDPNMNCEEEVFEPADRPVPRLPGRRPDRQRQRLRQEDRGRDRRQGLQGKVVHDPDLRRRLPTPSGSNGKSYHVIRIAAFYLDYISYSNNEQQRRLRR